MRPQLVAALPLSLCPLASALATNGFNCSFTLGPRLYNLTALPLPLNVTSSTPTPPTTTISQSLVSLCAPLQHDSTIPESDQCPIGTRVCMMLFNDKDSEPRRTVSVVPIVTDAESTSTQVSTLKNANSGGVTLTMNGSAYSGVKQSLSLTLICSTRSVPPTSLVYSAQEGSLTGIWEDPAACGTPVQGRGGTGHDNDTPKGGNDPAGKATGGFFSVIFTLLLIGGVAYFGIGIYYNYTTYGAGTTWWDLIPHRDFWRDLPLVVADLVKGRSGRSGYSSLS